MAARGMVPRAPGVILFCIKALLSSNNSLIKTVTDGSCTQQALNHAYPWFSIKTQYIFSGIDTTILERLDSMNISAGAISSVARLGNEIRKNFLEIKINLVKSTEVCYQDHNNRF
jgi:hypothetical protein